MDASADTFPSAPIGVLGKHPGFGDFVESGFSKPVEKELTRWIERTLPTIQAELGEDWKPWWRAAQTLRFWIGREVLGVALTGVLKPSEDKVKRFYPLILAAEGAALPIPGHGGQTDQAPYEALEAHLLRAVPGQGGARSLLDGIGVTLPAEDAAARGLGHTIWAHHPEGDLEALLRAAATADLTRAALRRSYWWSAGDETRAPVWLGCDGMPDARAMSWLLGGVATTEDADGT